MTDSFLCFDFRPVLEGHPDIVFAVHCDEIHQAAPQPGVELLDEFLLPKLLYEDVHLTAPGFAILDGFTGLVILRLRRFIPADQFIVVSVIIILVLRDTGVFGYELASRFKSVLSLSCSSSIASVSVSRSFSSVMLLRISALFSMSRLAARTNTSLISSSVRCGVLQWLLNLLVHR